MTESTSSVLIVGAGPTGCTAALLLAKLGIPTTLVERRSAPTSHPAAHIINARTIEVWAQISPDLADEMMTASPSLDDPTDIHWRTSLVGRKLGSFSPVPSDMDRALKLLSHSSYRTIHLGQHKVEPILWDWVRKNPLIDFRTGVAATLVEQTPDHVRVALSDNRDTPTTTTGTTHQYAYLLACEGAGSGIRKALGIAMPGETLSNVTSVFFRAKFNGDTTEKPPLLTWIYNPGFAGVLINHLHDEYILMTTYFPPAQDHADFDSTYWRQAIPKALGVTPTHLDIVSCGHWAMTEQVASRFRQGRIFLVGDAAHRFPPTGGYGLNTGVQDAHNLCWKLSAVLEDRAAASLLDSYESERKPVALHNCQRSVSNHYKMDAVTRHFGITSRGAGNFAHKVAKPPLSLLPRPVARLCVSFLSRLARLQSAILDKDNSRGAAIREKVAAEIPHQAEHFSAPGLELGFAYQHGVLLPEPGDKPVFGDGITEYRPTTWPGCRMPHLPIIVAGKSQSNHLLLDQVHFLLLCGPAQYESWAALLAGISIPDGMSIAVHEIQADNSTETPEEAWLRFSEVHGDGALLVRPDGHIAWRSQQAPADSGTLEQVLHKLWPTVVDNPTSQA